MSNLEQQGRLAAAHMKQRVLLAFALNRVHHMSFPELESCVRAQAGENLVLEASLHELVADGMVKLGKYSGEGWSVPKVVLMHPGSLPPKQVDRARAMLPEGKRFPRAGSYPRTILPEGAIEEIRASPISETVSA